LKSELKKSTASRSCGKCAYTIRVRDNLNDVLCTAILGMVDANFEDVCEHYIDRSWYLERKFKDPS
jgi:hypothetical protein